MNRVATSSDAIILSGASLNSVDNSTNLSDLLKGNPEFNRIPNYDCFLHLKNQLIWGPLDAHNNPIYQSFGFLRNGHHTYAMTSGLDGFQYTFNRLIKEHGSDEYSHHAQDVIQYVRDCCTGNPEFTWLLEKVGRIESAGLTGGALIEAVLGQVTKFCEVLRGHLQAYDQNSWIGLENTYYINPSHYNLNGRRSVNDRAASEKPFFQAFNSQDLQLVLDHADVKSVWISGIFKKGGKVLIDGELKYGWSPFAIADPFQLNEEFGSLTDFKNFIDLLKASEVKVIMDLVPNHCSHDSYLATNKPWCLIHRLAKSPDEPTPAEHVRIEHQGKIYFCPYARYRDDREPGHIGKLYGLLQLDLYNPETQEYIKEWIDYYVKLGVDGFRVDMGDCLTRKGYSLLWGGYTGRDVSSQPECLNSLRRAFPNVAFAIESYSYPDDLLRAGADAVDYKNSLPTRRTLERAQLNGAKIHWLADDVRQSMGRWEGFMDAVVNQDPDGLWISNHRHEFHANAGLGLRKFVTNHDCPALRRALKNNGHDPERAIGATLYAMLYNGGVMITAGQEVETDSHDKFLINPKTPRHTNGRPEEEDDKFLKFSIANEIDWSSNRAMHLYYRQLVALRRSLANQNATVFRASLEFDHPEFKRLPIYYLENAQGKRLYRIVYNVTKQPITFQSTDDKGNSYSCAVAPGDCSLENLVTGKSITANELFQYLKLVTLKSAQGFYPKQSKTAQIPK